MILNFGSINVDHVYRVAHLPKAGETLAASDYRTFLGGKGVNQSVAIHRAGGTVRHVGATGPDGSWAREQMRIAGVGTNEVASVAERTGHAVIAVDAAGENQIMIFAGANHCLTLDQINHQLDRAMAETGWVLVQNETNHVDHIVNQARHRDLHVAYSAAPFVAADSLGLLDAINLLVVNEIEHEALLQHLNTNTDALSCDVLVTRGSRGAELISTGSTLTQAAVAVSPVDTTGAGDTFLGSFLGRVDCGDSHVDALNYAAHASAIQVTREGAADAIPTSAEVLAALG